VDALDGRNLHAAETYLSFLVERQTRSDDEPIPSDELAQGIADVRNRRDLTECRDAREMLRKIGV
jgi:hypothetical protein